ncbi:MAG: hypothetical protein RSE01_07935 [Akkermansia sp.]
MNVDQITLEMDQLINSKVSEILTKKSSHQKYLDWTEMKEVCLSVKDACIKQFDEVPKGVEMACYFAEAVLAPGKQNKVKLIKKALSLGSGVSGLTMILTGIGAALGWGTGIVGFIIIFCTGMALPLTLVGVGITLTVIASYFYFNDGSEVLSNKAIDALSKGVKAALIDYIKQEEK